MNIGGEIMQEKLICLRGDYGITGEEMAMLIGVDVRTYANKECGVTQFKATEMFLIACKLKKGIEDIFYL